MPRASEYVPVGSRSTTLLADPTHLSACTVYWGFTLTNPDPTCIPPLVAKAIELRNPLAWRSTALEALPGQSAACPPTPPTSSPSPMPIPLVELGCSSMATYCARMPVPLPPTLPLATCD